MGIANLILKKNDANTKSIKRLSKKKRKYPELTALKGRIREKKTSYRKIAETLGIAVNTLSDKINGFYAMSCPEIEKIAEILEIEPNEVARFFLPSYQPTVIDNTLSYYRDRHVAKRQELLEERRRLDSELSELGVSPENLDEEIAKFEESVNRATKEADTLVQGFTHETLPNNKELIVCKRLKGLMAKSGLTVKELSKKTGISASSLSRKINGRRSWFFGELISIAKEFGFSEVKEAFPELHNSVLTGERASAS